jgi:hypothetical protein
MPNVSITYGDVDDAAAAMRNSKNNVIEPATDTAYAAIDDTLGTTLVMRETEMAIRDQYVILHGQLKELCTAIGSWADQFVAIKEGWMDMDRQYAENIRNPKP